MPRGTLREVLAEFLGTFVLILFGAGVVAQNIVSKQAAGSYLAINLAWGLGVVMGCYVSAGVSGAHLNPAVTLAAAVHRGFPWRKVLPYMAGQFVGAFVAAAVVYLTYREGLTAFDGGVRQVLGPQGTAGIFATYPQPYLIDVPGRVHRPGGRHGDSHRASFSGSPISGTRRRRPGSRRSSSACSSSASAWPSASIAATPSTPPGTSGRACSRRWPAGAARCSGPGTTGGGCRWWRRSSAASWAGGSTTCSWASGSRRRSERGAAGRESESPSYIGRAGLR